MKWFRNNRENTPKPTPPEKKCVDIQPRQRTNKEPWWLNEDEFYDVAEEAYDNLPEIFTKNLDNVFIDIRSEPSAEHARRVAPGYELLGLYVGVPLTHRNNGYGMMSLPDTIYLYMNPIQRTSPNREHAVQQIRKTLWHEVGHYYGLNDEELHKLGY